jgi:hypothetical protein
MCVGDRSKGRVVVPLFRMGFALSLLIDLICFVNQ